jgi:hypothetical protein
VTQDLTRTSPAFSIGGRPKTHEGVCRRLPLACVCLVCVRPIRCHGQKRWALVPRPTPSMLRWSANRSETPFGLWARRWRQLQRPKPHGSQAQTAPSFSMGRRTLPPSPAALPGRASSGRQLRQRMRCVSGAIDAVPLPDEWLQVPASTRLHAKRPREPSRLVCATPFARVYCQTEAPSCRGAVVAGELLLATLCNPWLPRGVAEPGTGLATINVREECVGKDTGKEEGWISFCCFPGSGVCRQACASQGGGRDGSSLPTLVIDSRDGSFD